jgi:hypothetical protein
MRRVFRAIKINWPYQKKTKAGSTRNLACSLWLVACRLLCNFCYQLQTTRYKHIADFSISCFFMTEVEQ